MDLQLSKCRTVFESRVRSPDRVPGQLDLIALPERPTVAHQVCSGCCVLRVVWGTSIL